MKVVVCGKCGLTQSIQTESKPLERIQTLSCEADWGNVRHGKGLRLASIEKVLSHHINWTDMKSILDVGSNRGNFSRWAFSKNPKAKIKAIEPDESITEDYCGLEGLDLSHARFEEVLLEDHAFDFVYCSHTLEHALSAAGMLNKIYQTMKLGAFLFLEVPALEGLQDSYGVEEYFMDKHTFHFDRRILSEFVESLGFEILEGKHSKDILNISFLLRKTGKVGVFPAAGLEEVAEQNKNLIQSYQTLLPKQWQLLKTVVEARLQPLAERQKVVYWGAGRIFDALVKYGALNPAGVFGLVDGHLWKVIGETHGVVIERPEKIRLLEPQVVVVLARTSEEVIAKKAYAMGVRHVLRFSELMDQCRIGN